MEKLIQYCCPKCKTTIWVYSANHGVWCSKHIGRRGVVMKPVVNEELATVPEKKVKLRK